MNVLSWLLGFDNVQSIDSIELSLSAPWVVDRVWVVSACCLVAVIAASAFYQRIEEQRARFVMRTLIVIRAALLVMLVLTLAAPLLQSSATIQRQPKVLVVIDNSQSMRLADASGITRARQVGQLASGDDSLFTRLAVRHDCQLSFYSFSAAETTQLEPVTLRHLEDGLSCVGQRTDIAAALHESAARARAMKAAAVILISDFADNARGSLTPANAMSETTLPTQTFTIGLGEAEPRDLAVKIQGEAKAKLGEAVTLQVSISQERLTGHRARLRVVARALTRYDDTSTSAELVHTETIELRDETTQLDITYTPQVAGPVELQASVEPLTGERLPHNNVSTHRIEVIADHLRLLYVGQEPTWEWRFIKEALHRDDLVGLDGFRTYLASSSRRVRQTNTLFLPELVSPRKDFFATDVVLLDDMPGEALNAEFCAMIEEFVGDFGGGLVVLAGPRFGPSQLLDTPLAAMLPVHLSPDTNLRDDKEFALHVTNAAQLYPLMTLAESANENKLAWGNLGRLPWYHPVVSVHEQADVLAEHPSDVCDDGETHQPLIAIRPYGKGQVVYLCFNETWRLRSGVGQRYHQRFWSQLIYRLGMSHPVGARKRFAMHLDRDAYRVGATATLTVDAFDVDFRPLLADPGGASTIRASLRQLGDESATTRPIVLTPTTAGRFEADMKLDDPGEYQIEVLDPVTEVVHHELLRVADVSTELQNVARDAELQQRIAAMTGGQAYELQDVDRMIEDLRLQPETEREHRAIAVWHTPLWFLVVAGLMLGEWTTRRLVHLR